MNIKAVTINQPDAELVQMLEDLTNRAKSGEIKSVAFAVTKNDQSIETGWEGGKFTRLPLASAIYMLQHRYAAAIITEDSE